jgi:SAM-dependent methyltransferase
VKNILLNKNIIKKYGEYFWEEQLPTGRLVELINKYGIGLSLDAACGKGPYLKTFKGKVIGFDINKKFIKKAKGENNKLEFCLGDISVLPFHNRTFNFILCSEACMYLNKNDLARTFREFNRIIKNRGMICISVLNNYSFLIKFLRYIFYRQWSDYLSLNSGCSNKKWFLMNNDFLKKSKLNGFKIHGCLGWVTEKKIKSKFIIKNIDLLMWYIPILAGTIIACKIRGK